MNINYVIIQNNIIYCNGGKLVILNQRFSEVKPWEKTQH
jgi:hypothetical protein